MSRLLGICCLCTNFGQGQLVLDFWFCDNRHTVVAMILANTRLPPGCLLPSIFETKSFNQTNLKSTNNGEFIKYNPHEICRWTCQLLLRTTQRQISQIYKMGRKGFVGWLTDRYEKQRKNRCFIKLFELLSNNNRSRGMRLIWLRAGVEFTQTWQLCVLYIKTE